MPRSPTYAETVLADKPAGYWRQPYGGLLQQSGPLSGATWTDNTAVGTLAWSPATNAAVNDGNFANVLFGSGTTHYLRGVGFGFAIPTNATITGVQAWVRRRKTGVISSVVDNIVRLMKAGVVGGSNLATATEWSLNTVEDAFYGGSSNLWGNTLTPADINNANFGIVVSATLSSASCDIDWIGLTVYYTVVNDDSGNGNFGSATAVTQVAGLLVADADSAGDYDGSTSHTNIPDSVGLSPSRYLTLEAWVRPDTVTGVREFIRKRTSYGLRFNGTALEYFYFTGGSPIILTAVGFTAAIGQTYHVVYSNANGVQFFCVNGTFYSLKNSGGDVIDDTTQNIIIGASANDDVISGYSEVFDGKIDEVAIYNYGLTEEQAATHWSVGVTAEPSNPQGKVEIALGSTAGADYFQSVLVDIPFWFLRCSDTTSTMVNETPTNFGGGNNVTNGTWFNSPTFSVDGPLPNDVATAVRLNGSTQYGTILSSGYANGSWTSMTFEAWIKPETISVTQIIFELGNGAGPYGPHFYVLGGTTGSLGVNFVDSAGTSHSLFSPAGSIRANVWQHVIARYDGAGTAAIWINGALVAFNSPGIFSLRDIATSFWSIGRRPDSSLYFQGALANLAIYYTSTGSGVSLPENRMYYHFAARNVQRPLAWTDISSYVRSYRHRSGKQYELDRYEAGSASVLFKNGVAQSRRFEPEYGGGNEFSNPSAEVDTQGWTGYGSGNGYGSVIRRTTDNAPASNSGTCCFEYNDSLSQNAMIIDDNDYDRLTNRPVSPSQRVYAKAYGKYTAANAGGTITLTFYLRWVGSGAVVRDDILMQITNPTVNTWYAMFGSAVAPAGADCYGVIMAVASTAVAASTTVRMDRVWALKEIELVDYVDGNSTGYEWAGPAHRSVTRLQNSYYPYIVPNKEIRIGEQRDGVYYPGFHGWVQSWEPNWVTTTYGECGVDAVDGFAIVAGGETEVSISGAVGAAGGINNALAYGVKWRRSSTYDTDRRSVALVRNEFYGTVAAQSVAAGTNNLDVIRRYEATEWGEFYFDRQGRPTFRLRNSRVGTPVLSVFGDGPGEISYTNLAPALDPNRVVNDVEVTRTGGALQNVKDLASQHAHGVKSVSYTTENSADAGALTVAQLILSRGRRARLRIEGIELVCYVQNNVRLQHALLREIGDRVQIIRRPDPNSNRILSQIGLIAGITVSRADSKILTVSFSLVPAP